MHSCQSTIKPPCSQNISEKDEEAGTWEVFLYAMRHKVDTFYVGFILESWSHFVLVSFYSLNPQLALYILSVVQVNIKTKWLPLTYSSKTVTNTANIQSSNDGVRRTLPSQTFPKFTLSLIGYVNKIRVIKYFCVGLLTKSREKLWVGTILAKSECFVLEGTLYVISTKTADQQQWLQLLFLLFRLNCFVTTRLVSITKSFLASLSWWFCHWYPSAFFACCRNNIIGVLFKIIFLLIPHNSTTKVAPPSNTIVCKIFQILLNKPVPRH